jgi:hypothetical protein
MSKKYMPLRLEDKLNMLMDEIYKEIGACRLILTLGKKSCSISCTEPVGSNRKFDKDFIDTIYELRNRRVNGRKMTHKQIAKSLGCSPSYVGAVLRGERGQHLI